MLRRQDGNNRGRADGETEPVGQAETAAVDRVGEHSMDSRCAVPSSISRQVTLTNGSVNDVRYSVEHSRSA